MDNVDLNLENYTLKDLLNLFDIPINFTSVDLKIIKKKVLHLHPDKCSLDKSYFLFYCKAYRMITKIHDFKEKKQEFLDNTNAEIQYDVEQLDEFDSKTKKQLLDKILKKEKGDFNKWFNESFETMYVDEENKRHGYSNWLASEQDLDTTESASSLATMHERINQKKEQLSSIVKRHEIQDMNSNSNSNYNELDSGKPASYSSNMFSSGLQYEDLKIAHTETVIPVSDKDYKNMLKFDNVESLKQHRNSQNIVPLSETDVSDYMSNREKRENQKGINLAYRMAKESDIITDKNKTWWGNLMRLQ